MPVYCKDSKILRITRGFPLVNSAVPGLSVSKDIERSTGTLRENAELTSLGDYSGNVRRKIPIG